MEKERSGIDPKFILPIVILIINIVFCVISVNDVVTKSKEMMLYRAIGATPWHKPEIEQDIEKSEIFSEDDINTAVQLTTEKFYNEWYTYNGTYLLKLSYSDDFNRKICKIKGYDDMLCLPAKMFTGYGDTVAEENKGKYHENVFWGIQKQPDGSWKCLGCAQIPKEYYYDDISDEAK